MNTPMNSLGAVPQSSLRPESVRMIGNIHPESSCKLCSLGVVSFKFRLSLSLSLSRPTATGNMRHSVRQFTYTYEHLDTNWLSGVFRVSGNHIRIKVCVYGMGPLNKQHVSVALWIDCLIIALFAGNRCMIKKEFFRLWNFVIFVSVLSAIK